MEINVQPGLEVVGDTGLLQGLVTNLLENAWKFSSKQPVACIEFGRVEKNGEIVQFVRDNGVGFDQAFATKLFSPFQRMHSASEFPGSGIGLANCQRIVARHGGRIWAEAAVSQGATFFVKLPLYSESAMGGVYAS